MSVPHSTILSCSRGVLAKTDVGYCSPKQSQNSSSYAENNVKVVVYPKKETQNENPYATTNDSTENSNEIKERSMVQSAIIKNKDMLIQALVLSLDIIQNNPLIINKYVIADEHELALLIKYLTEHEHS